MFLGKPWSLESIYAPPASLAAQWASVIGLLFGCFWIVVLEKSAESSFKRSIERFSVVGHWLASFAMLRHADWEDQVSLEVPSCKVRIMAHIGAQQQLSMFAHVFNSFLTYCT